ncbi:X-Pro dipeptidyl-peptidase [Dyadobacter sp. Leaf189]|nr:X-Pro dipeptidyl-peptidase [Dyadobacter sp. Leaf189]
MGKLSYYLLFAIVLTGIASNSSAQKSKFNLYEQTSETAGLVMQYDADIQAVRSFYSPMLVRGRGFAAPSYVLNSPEQRKRLTEVDKDYLARLSKVDFDAMSIYGKVDYILLKRNIDDHLFSLAQEEKEYSLITKYIPFADKIYALEKQRRRGATVEGQKVAAELNSVLKEVNAASESLKKVDNIDMPLATRAEDAIKGMEERLKGVYDFYNGYDPMFTWWVPKPYQALDSALTVYAKSIKSKGKLNTTQKEDKSGIKGVPIGRDELIRQLGVEMISYTPEELIELANKEFAWCDKELLKASQEMGFGNEWQKAQEKVKNSFVPEGEQPALIMKLYNDAKEFITKNNLYQYPEIADETWGMQMMTPERQLINPFFLGGRDIIISYPTNTMNHEDKLMSMRGNNPYFSRSTVHHELVPGHHLQYYMRSRYKSYRQEFGTPFWTEGWALYWELLLYDKGFAKTPEERIGMLFWRMHRCARIIFSLNYHLGKWTPQECIDFLVDRVGHERANAEGEVRRSFQGNYSPLYQIAYLIGGLQIFSLKKELVDSGRMTFQQFHDAVMKENNMPIEMLRATLTNQALKREFKTQWKFYSFK